MSETRRLMRGLVRVVKLLVCLGLAVSSGVLIGVAWSAHPFTGTAMIFVAVIVVLAWAAYDCEGEDDNA